MTEQNNKNYELINIDQWKRKFHYALFKDALQPQYNVCLELDITSFYSAVKANKWSFTLAFIHTITTVANGIENFRYRFIGEEVVLYDQINTSFTYLNPQTELFKVVNVDYCEQIDTFVEQGKQAIILQEQYITGPIPNDVYQFSSLPNIKFTHFSHTLGEKSKKSNPMFDWGKFEERGGRVTIPFSLQVHHSFIDGFHVGQFIEQLQRKLNSF